MDVINCLAYVSNQLTGNGNPPAVDADLENYRRLLREQIDVAPKEKIGGVTYAQDGVVYKDGYRVEKFDDDRLDQLNVKIRELEQRSQEKDQKLDLLNVKLDELERRSVEREIEIEGLRSRSVSRAGSQEPTTSRGVPSIVLGEQQSDTRYGSNRFRPIHREDDSRKTIKKRSVTSNVSEDRTDELDLLSQMEEEEAKKMEDYVPLVYNRDEYLSEGNKRHKISPIQELCQMHEDEHRHRIMEHSPEPNFGANISKPWGDIQLEETKKHEKLAPQAVHDIKEETRESDESDDLAKSMEETKQWLKSPRNTFPDVSTSNQDLLSPGVYVPTGVRSRSESPEEEHPTLKRTRKKSDLTALLLEEERRAEAFSGVIIQTEESDSEGGRRTEFLQSKSPSPFVGPFIENERYQQSTGQLIALVLEPEEQSVSPEHKRKKRNLTAAQLEEERRAEAFYGVTVPSDESDSEGVNRTEFVRSKSATPNFSTCVEKERFQQSAGQLTPLLTDSEVQSVSQEHQRKKRDLSDMQLEDERCTEAESPTTNVDNQETMHPEERSISQEYQQLSSTSLPLSPSRDATISPAPIASSGSPASPVSSIVDESVKDGLPYYQSGDDRSVSSSSAAGGSVSAAAPVESEENVSRAGSVSLASSTGRSASLDLHVDLAVPPRTPSPTTHTGLAVAGGGGGAAGAGRQSPKSPSVEDTRPPSSRRFRMRTRKVRSVTPIDFNQTFMDDFTEQRISVSPSELEDYINSLDEIKIDPPKPVTPNFFLPTTPMTSGVPSLIVTDDKGEDARFHDSLSTKAFYGDHTVDLTRVLNHRVSYVEWMKKFPESMTSHLELEDYDSDDEEVESIINGAQMDAPELPEPKDSPKFPVDITAYDTPSPEPQRDLLASPEIPPGKSPEVHTEFPLNVVPAYATPSPVSQLSEVSESESAPELSSMALGSPLLNSTASPRNTHFTPITSPLSSLKSPTPDPHSLSPHSIPRLYIPSPSVSPIPMDMTPEEAIFDIGHLDGLIFETKSRSPTPQVQPQSLCPLSPEELAYDIGNLGGLILGPPSRSTSPLPPSPTPGSLQAPFASSSGSARNTKPTDTKPEQS
ncbi:uncharacterized protein LOC120415778 isoform X2 [Culex pipiens pallens]|nr:uncharacterized protein LOC120415778 isoform X2 [Culex pipiens pallens]XP_052566308.1 uncharacterized protein LOC120415778 isoform X2 [Culex pipiens pallens]XP_052566309.1 uncharacterized protein LOC120415778 isoform X2 [Culex pipiens pallens]